LKYESSTQWPTLKVAARLVSVERWVGNTIFLMWK